MTPAREGSAVPSLLFIVGRPLGHSLSPAMHNGVIRRLGLPLRYVPVELSPGVLADFLRAVRGANVLGGNVTIPYKEEAARLADERSEAVAFCGAANVLVVRRGRLRAENSDGPGLLAALSAAGWGRRFRSAVLLGAGGAARGIGYALARSGTQKLSILNRNQDRARQVVRDLGRAFPRTALSAGPLDGDRIAREFKDVDLIVQCTSLGLREEWPDFPFKAIQKGSRFADIVYRRGGTALVRRLRRMGIPAMDGLPMLAHQAALGFAAWTGRRIPPDTFLAHARRALAAR